MMMAAPMSMPLDRDAPARGSALATARKAVDHSFRALVVDHQRMVFALLSRMLGPGPEVEDLAQETFVRAYRAYASFDPNGPAKVSTWLLTIAVRLALDTRKKNARKQQNFPEIAVERESDPRLGDAKGPDPESALEKRRLGDALSAAAATLPDDQRAALVLSDAHGLSIAEIAAALEIPEATAKTRIFRAREKMRAALTEWRSS